MSSDFTSHDLGGTQLPFDLNEAAGDLEEAQLQFDLNEPAEQMEENEEENLQVQTHQNGHHQTSRQKLSTSKRMEILLWLLNRTTLGKLKRGSILAAAHEFQLSSRCISTLWNTAKAQKEAGQQYNLATKFHNAGRKRIHIPPEAITALKMGDRSCKRDLASKLNVSKTTVHRMVQRGVIRPHTNPLHPAMKEANMKRRLAWALRLLEGDNPETKKRYYTMYDFVHINEKWFYQSKKSHRVYLAQGEKGKYRSAASSKFIPKVMFTACVARPRFNADGQCTFDGKIGIFPFIYKEPAKRKSKNRDKGTIVTKLIESVNKNVTRSMLINQIIPAIKQKWPAHDGHKVIFIQQDNAKTHITQEDHEWQEVFQQEDFTFILLQQPPNSPDLNILDLGFLRSIQSLMHKKMSKDVDKMLEAVHDAFYELQAQTLADVWITLQHVLNEVLKSKGGNEYDLPHVSKKKMAAQVLLQTQVEAPMWAVQEAWILVNQVAQPIQEAEDEGDTQDIADIDSQEY